MKDKLFAVIVPALLFAAGAPAAPLTWDPLFNGGLSAGSGNWDTMAGNTNWYNGVTDNVWTQTSATLGLNAAIFNGPDVASGTYLVTNDALQIAVTNLTINNSGYTFSGANAIFLGASDFLNVAAGKTVTFNCNMAGSGTSPCWVLGSAATLNFAGNLASGQQLHLAGPASSQFNLSGTNAPANLFVQAPVNVASGSVAPTSSFYIGYNQTLPAPNSTAYGLGSFTIANATLTVNGNFLIIGRATGTGTLTMQDGSAVNVGIGASPRALAIDYDGSVGSSGTVNVNGGTLTVGTASLTAATSAIEFFATGENTGATAVMNQTAGTVFAWGGILFGATTGTPGSAALTNSGGILYVGKNGVFLNTVPPSLNLTLSGGTVGALANWSSSVPMTLGTANNNITFQCADNNNAPFNISLSGALTGAGGLNVTGPGTLTLSGANNYSGTTVVSNGTLAIMTGASPITNGPVTVDGSAGSPVISVTVTTPGQYWTNNGALTFQNGTPTAGFQFGALAPSATVAPVQVNGNVAFAATPNVNVNGAAIAVGSYPLIKYTGATNGAMPNIVNINLSGGSASGYLTNFSTTKTIALVVTSSTYNPALSWRVGSGVWDINTTSNWTQFNAPARYTDGNAVIFDDTAAGPSPITVTLNTTVNPLNVTFNNAAPTNYTITGSGSITGLGNVSLLGSGTVTLGGSNSYSGGTVISAGQLNINNGGDAGTSAIGTGPLTVNAGAVLDNTSGADVTLQASIPETWNGNFTYLGSANNFNTGPGQVTMNGDILLAVNASDLAIGGNISDNSLNLQLTKTGNGALTLPVANNFGGGLTLASGLLNLGDPGAVGSGVFTINGGAIDNGSGAEFVLTPASSIWGGSFSFLGSTNLDLGGTISIPNGLGSITVNIASNTLTTDGAILNNNTTVIKTGNGTWVLAGSASGESLGLVVSAGEVVLDKSGGQAIAGGNNVGLTVQTNALVLNEASFQIHSDTAIPLPVNLNGGVWDLNGFDENVDQLSISGGTLRNGASASTSTLTLISGYPAMLTGANCQFDVEATNGFLNVKGVITGSGSLVKNGLGVLNLMTNETYSGNTIVNSGTLALPGVSSLSNTRGINLVTANSILDVSGNTDTNGNPTPVLTLLSGQTLSGVGTLNGSLQTANGSTLAPGSASAIGTLTVTGSGTNTLGSITAMKLNKSGNTNDQLAISGSLVYGGTLALTNLSGSLANGDSFALFNAAGGYSGSFAGISPSRPGFPAFGLAWDTNNLAVNGTLAVVTAPVPARPRITGVNLSGTTLSLLGTNGVAGEPFLVRTSTDLAAPLSAWVPVSTNTFDTNGNFNISISVTNFPPPSFFDILVE